MRVLQVHNHYRDPGGEDVVVGREAEALEAAGHNVHQHLITNDASTLTTLRGLAASPWNQAQALALSRVIKGYKPDVVHIHNTWFRFSPAVIKAASQQGVATVHTLHNYRSICINGQLLRNNRPCDSCLTEGAASALSYRCYRSSIPLSVVAAGTRSVAQRFGVWSEDIDRFITMTPTTKALFERWGFPASRIAVRPHRIDDPGTRTATPSDSTSLLFVGRLEVAKGIEELCKQWMAANTRLELTVIGDGPLGPRLRRAYPKVNWLGPRPPEEVADAMKAARSLVFPSLWEETFGNVVVEALATGLPTLVSSTAPIGDYLAPLGTDWVFDVDSAEDWTRAFALVADGESVDTASPLAREIFETNFRDDGAESLLEVYDEALQSRKERSLSVESNKPGRS